MKRTPFKQQTLRGLTNADLPPGVTLRRVPLAKKRSSRPKMTPARKAAKGQACMIRLPGCLGVGETTVLAHYRMSGYCGTGGKPDDDVFGAWACANCHDAVDGRRNTGLPRVELRLAHAEGCMRTQIARRSES